jgi:hypothetical protein
MENVGREPNRIHGTMHFGQKWPLNSHLGEFVQLPPPNETFASDFHVYAVDWSPGQIQWFVDGYQYSVKTIQDVTALQLHWPFDQEFHFLLNLAVGGQWPGYPDATTSFPQQMLVDYVRVYDKSFGRLTGPGQVNASNTQVEFELLDGLSDYTYTWSVPSGSFVLAGDSTSKILVNMGSSSGHVSVLVESPGKCGGTAFSKTFTMPVLIGADIPQSTTGGVTDCNCPTTCTANVLNQLSANADGSYTCSARIDWLMSVRQMTQTDACTFVANEFPSVCGAGCDPRHC